MTEMTFDFLATELTGKLMGLGKLGMKAKLVFEGMGTLNVDTRGDTPVITRGEGEPADITVSAPLQVWLDMRAKKIAPHVAAMTRKLKVEGDLVRGMKLAPHIMGVL